MLEVAPLVGAWVETMSKTAYWNVDTSRPSWARGLKRYRSRSLCLTRVAPLVGAWVETYISSSFVYSYGRAPRGRVG